MEFKNKNVFITGGTRGIGFQIAKAFANEGASVIINGRKSLDFNLDEHGIKSFYQFDIAKSSDVNSNVNKLLEEYEKIDILINNAGLTRDTLFLRMSDEQWHDVINANLTGVFNVTRALSKQFIKNRSGAIINITSIVGQTGNIGQANYVASKAGIIGLTKSMALEFASRNIRVNAIAPGFIETSMTNSLSDEIVNEYLKKIPLKCFGKPEDIANTALFLASEKSSYITGQVINVNGGMLM